MASLREAYGRDVPDRVQLSDDYDAELGSPIKPGVILSVVVPPPNVEVDDVSLWVDAAGKPERLYEHEFKVLANAS